MLYLLEANEYDSDTGLKHGSYIYSVLEFSIHFALGVFLTGSLLCVLFHSCFDTLVVSVNGIVLYQLVNRVTADDG
jgi:hypothetical protein